MERCDIKAVDVRVVPIRLFLFFFFQLRHSDEGLVVKSYRANRSANACAVLSNVLRSSSHTNNMFRENSSRIAAVQNEGNNGGDFVQVFVLTSSKNNVNWMPISLETIYMDIK